MACFCRSCLFGVGWTVLRCEIVSCMQTPCLKTAVLRRVAASKQQQSSHLSDLTKPRGACIEVNTYDLCPFLPSISLALCMVCRHSRGCSNRAGSTVQGVWCQHRAAGTAQGCSWQSHGPVTKLLDTVDVAKAPATCLSAKPHPLYG